MLVATNETRAAQPSHLRHDDTPSRPIAHSGRLVYAKPQDLPSFPSIGLGVSAAAAATAATTAAALGWANKKPPESGSPAISTCVSTAAAMAEDNISARLQQESVGRSHVTNDALLAAQSATSHSVSNPSSLDQGITAATQASRLNCTGTCNNSSVGVEHHGSLVAAKGAVARRQRAESVPIPRKPCLNETNAAANALGAATRARHPAVTPVSLEEVGAIPYTTLDRQMFTSQPPVQVEVDEKKRADELHASAVAMAKKMYNQQQKMIDAMKCDADKTSQRNNMEVSSSISDDPQSAQLTTLQDAAYRQAQARLAKIQLENDQNTSLKGHHGTNPLSRRLSLREMLRKRSSSDGALTEDKRKSQQIRKRMSLFSNRLPEVGEQNRPHDRDLLLAAAQRNVHERLREMDEQIANETGMMPPGTLTHWERRARPFAQLRTSRKDTHQQGKVTLGTGIHMDQEDINVIAARRVQPVLNEINAKADEKHARQTEAQQEIARKKEEQEMEKARQREVHDAQKSLKQREKQEQKGRKAEEKQDAKMQKEEKKAAKNNRKRLSRFEKLKLSNYEQRALASEENIITINSSGQPVKVPRPSTQENQANSNVEKTRGMKSPPGRLYNWIKSRFLRKSESTNEEQNEGRLSQRSFVGGASLTGYQNNKSSTSFDNRSASMRAVTMAGKYASPHPPGSGLGGGAGAVVPLDSESDNDFFRQGIGARPVFTAPRPIRTSSPAHSQGSVRDSRFLEDI